MKKLGEKTLAASDDPRIELGMRGRPLGECLANALSPKKATDEQWARLLARAGGRNRQDLAEFNDFRKGQWLNAVFAAGREGEVGRERFAQSFGSQAWVRERVELAGVSDTNEGMGSDTGRSRAWPYSFTAQANKVFKSATFSLLDLKSQEGESEPASDEEAQSIALAFREWAQAWIDVRIERQTDSAHTFWLVEAFDGVGRAQLLAHVQWEEPLRAARRNRPGAFVNIEASWPMPANGELSAGLADLIRARSVAVDKTPPASEWARWIGKGPGCADRVRWLQKENLLDAQEWAKLSTLRSLSGEARAVLESQWLRGEMAQAAAQAPQSSAARKAQRL